MEKKKYEGMKLDVVTIEAEDVIVTSNPCDKLPWDCPGDTVFCKKNASHGCCTVGEMAR